LPGQPTAAAAPTRRPSPRATGRGPGASSLDQDPLWDAPQVRPDLAAGEVLRTVQDHAVAKSRLRRGSPIAGHRISALPVRSRRAA